VTVAALAPEVCLALQGLALALVPHGPNGSRGTSRASSRGCACAWRQVQLAAGEAALELDEHELLQVVHAWSIDGVLDPSRLLRRLVTADDVRLRAAGLGWIEPAVRQLAVTPTEAFALLVPLAADVDARLRARAVATLCKGWVRGLSPTASRERERLVVAALVDPEVAVVQAAVGCRGGAGSPRLVARAGARRRGGRAARVDALIEALGPLARDEDIDVGARARVELAAELRAGAAPLPAGGASPRGLRARAAPRGVARGLRSASAVDGRGAGAGDLRRARRAGRAAGRAGPRRPAVDPAGGDPRGELRHARADGAPRAARAGP
jgi:hypothetical protein